MRKIIPLFVVWAVIAFHPLQGIAEEETAAGGEVRIPYQRFEEIYKTLKEREWEERHPPKGAILTSADYQARIEEKNTQVTATLKLMVLKDRDWVSLPVLPAGLAIRNARVDGQTARLFTENGRHFLASDSPGEHTLEVEFSVKGGHQGVASLTLPVLPTPTTQLKVEIPLFAGSALRVSPAEGSQSSQVGDKLVVDALIPATERIEIAWQRPVAAERGLPPKLFAELSTLLSIGEGVIRQDSLIKYSILQAPITSFTLHLPKGFNVLMVGGDDLKEWKVVPKEKRQDLTVSLNEAHQGNYLLSLKGEVVLPGTSAEGEIPEIELAGVEREEGHIGIVATTNVEISPESVTPNIGRIDVQEVPRDVWDLSQNPLLLGFKYLKHPYEVALKIQKHEDLPVLVAAADSVQGLTVCSLKGECVSRAVFQVRNNLKQFLKVKLPPEAVLWSSFVSERPVKPGRNEEGDILIPLEKSRGDFEEATSFPLEIVYYRKENRFWPVGGRRYPLPLPDIPISRVAWSFYFPENVHFGKFFGTMEDHGPRWSLLPTLARPSRMLAGLPSGAPKDYYGINKGEMEEGEEGEDIQVPQAAAPMPPQVQMFDQKGLALLKGEIAQAANVGVLPVRFELPEEGKLYTFSQLFVESSAPSLWTFYIRRSVQVVVTLALFACFVVWTLRGLKFWQRQGWKGETRRTIGLGLIGLGGLVLAYLLRLAPSAVWLGVCAAMAWYFWPPLKARWVRWRRA